MAEEEEKKQQAATSDSEVVDVTANRGYSRIHIPTAKVILNNFLGGLAWGFGTVLGASLVAGLVIFVLSKLNSIPVVGDFFSSILQSLQQPLVK